MKIWVAVTDKSWYEYLSRLEPDEINFWQPSGSQSFRVLTPGELFLFKLHSPHNCIVGGGHFVRYSALPASLAWEAFERKNGVASFADLRVRIHRYRKGEMPLDPIIGCNVLAEPFFLPPDKWIAAPGDWSSNIVKGKTYESTAPEGRRLLDLLHRAAPPNRDLRDAATPADVTDVARYGADYLTRGRLGQGTFRVLVTDAYARRCAVTGEKTLPVLEAAHIKAFASLGPNRVNNGVLLRSDLHKLFDLGYVTVTPELRLEVSARLREDWENGRDYYAHHGKPLRVRPADSASWPAKEYLEWHNEHVFKA